MLAAPIIDRAPTPVRFGRVLFPTDFSPCADRALTYVLRIAATYDSEIFILHVLPPEMRATSETVTNFVPHLFNFDRHEAEKHIRCFENLGTLSQVKHSILLESGALRDVLEDTIRRHDIDIVVLGTHGRGGIKKLFLGSVAEEVSRRAPCAVMLVGPRVPPALPGCTFRHILYATEFSTGSLDALHYALSIAHNCRGHLTMLHVCSFLEGGPFVENETVVAHEKERLRSLVPEDIDLPGPPTVVARTGITPDTILATARECNADLIVMGVRSTHAVTATHIPWTIEHHVVCQATCPVLTVRG